MLGTLDHVCLTVSNLQRSMRFYQDCFGFVFARGGDYKGQLVDELTSYKGGELAVGFLATGGAALELIEFRNPKDGHPRAPRMHDVGAPHLGLLTTDVQADYKRLTGMGVEFVGPPVFTQGRGGYTALLRDPDGILIELIQRPSLLPSLHK